MESAIPFGVKRLSMVLIMIFVITGIALLTKISGDYLLEEYGKKAFLFLLMAALGFPFLLFWKWSYYVALVVFVVLTLVAVFYRPADAIPLFMLLGISIIFYRWNTYLARQKITIDILFFLLHSTFVATLCESLFGDSHWLYFDYFDIPSKKPLVVLFIFFISEFCAFLAGLSCLWLFCIGFIIKKKEGQNVFKYHVYSVFVMAVMILGYVFF